METGKGAIDMAGSEVARLLRQIEEEYMAAQRGLTGLAYGTAQHEFITRRMENMAIHHASLQRLVGEEEAGRLLAKTLKQVQ
jgi:hypothetical protein